MLRLLFFKTGLLVLIKQIPPVRPVVARFYLALTDGIEPIDAILSFLGAIAIALPPYHYLGTVTVFEYPLTAFRIPL